LPMIVAGIIEKTTKMKLDEFAKKYLFEPLQITNFRWIKDSTNFYCINISPMNDEDDNNIFAVIRSKPKKINATINKNIIWNLNKWHKIRIERNIVDTSIKVFFDNMKTPFMETIDRTFIMGYVGFGIGTGSARISNIKIWSQTSIPLPAVFFKQYIN